jgi:hypothetical protein|tara:strand:- start:119 stop:745 length:627 start_codon:yes stop_codon:yes gene_type:complete
MQNHIWTLEQLAKKASRGDEWAFNLVVSRVRRKIHRLGEQGVSLPKWDKMLRGIETRSVLASKEFPIMYGRDVDIKLHYGSKRDFLKYEEKFVDAMREKDKIIFLNPFLGKVQSWYDPSSLDYIKHKHISANPRASKYCKDVNKDEVELFVFNNGSGYLDPKAPDRRMYLELDLKREIGTKGETTVRLQVDRMRRPKGYKTELHGHPI